MSERVVSNAKIRSTLLGFEDHGIFTCYLNLDYHGGGQSFGGHVVDDPPKVHDAASERRALTGYGVEFIKAILRVAGVDRWENLPGTYIRVDHEHSKVHRIGNILSDDWFDPVNLFEEFYPKESK